MDKRSEVGELFSGPSGLLPEMSDGPATIREHWCIVSNDEVSYKRVKGSEVLLKHEQERNKFLREIGNHLHESCIVSNDEMSYKRVKGDKVLLKHEQERDESLREIGNHLHELYSQ